MNKSIKFKDDAYLDSSSVAHNKELLSEFLENEKSKLNKLSTYSTEETVIGTWLGKPLYRKVIECGALPNNTTKSILTGFKKGEIFITKFSGTTTNGTTQYSLPYVHTTTIAKNISIYADVPSNNNIAIMLRTGEDRSSQTATVIIEYTKTTD